MEAVQALTGSGGWPLNVFLLPDTRPFYGGTYFPPRSYQNMPSWTQLLNGVIKSYNEKREQIEEQAEKITSHIKGMDTMILGDENAVDDTNEVEAFSKDDVVTVYNTLSQSFDTNKGGFGSAPKFPNTMNIDFLLRFSQLSGHQEAQQHAHFTLNQMIAGGIYDQIGGGFARYSTDPNWLVPHFEKMLYDNALLVGALADAYKQTKDSNYEEVLRESLGFIEREMTSADGGFYSALDADSEGEEGKYYVWQKEEIDNLLQEEAELFEAFYGVTTEGNWEGTNILHRPKDYETFADEWGMDQATLKDRLQKAKQILLQARQKRTRPGLDDKILLAWNALMARGYLKAYTALGETHYREMAKQNLDFLLNNFSADQDGALYHSYKDGTPYLPAFLDDYAFLIQALILYYTATFDESMLRQAIDLTSYVMTHYADSEKDMFYYTKDGQEDVLFRKRDLFDNAIPSANAVMAMNLQKIGVIKGEFAYLNKAETMLRRIWPTLVKYPSGFGQWNQLLLNVVYPMPEIAVVGDDFKQKAFTLQREFIPDYVMMGTEDGSSSSFPLLQDKTGEQNAYFYVCRNYSCQKPVQDIDEVLQMTRAQ